MFHLLGSSDSTWKQGEWVYEPQTSSNDNSIQIKHYDKPKNGETFHRIDDDANEYDLKSIEFLSECWPKHWLPIDFPNARVVAINYNTGNKAT